MPRRSSLIYRDARLYDLAMLLLEGRGARDRRRMLAEAVEPGSSVVDLCCGTAAIAPLLIARGCRYQGLDVNPAFVSAGVRRGLNVRMWDAETMPIPEADVVCMFSSLYQFIPNDEQLVRRMLRSARRRVIISEPTRNWASSRLGLLRWVGRRMTRIDGRVFPNRHSPESLESLVAFVPDEWKQLVRAPRETIVIVDLRGSEARRICESRRSR